MQRPDAQLIIREYRLMADMLMFGARRLLLETAPRTVAQADLLLDLDRIELEFKALWLERSPSGGLTDSAARLHSVVRFLTERADR